MSTEGLFVCTPRQVRGFMVDTMLAGLVPFVQSSPGVGKSSITMSIANEYNAEMIDHRLSTSAPEDLSGLPRFDEKGHARFSPFADLFPLEDRELPEDKDGWILFLDEFNSAPKEVQAAAYKLILDRKVGQHKLHEKVMICAAGNKATDRAITNKLSTAMQSRLVHLELRHDFTEWLEDVAIPQNYDSRIIAFLSQFEGKLMDFRPDHNEKTFCCPRTWEFVNRLIKNKPVLTQAHAPLLAGTITSGIATEFITYTEIFKELITIEEVMKDPHGCRLPNSVAGFWAMTTHLLEKVNDQTLDNIFTYVMRFEMSFYVLFGRMLMTRYPKMRAHPAFAKALMTLNRYLNPTT